MAPSISLTKHSKSRIGKESSNRAVYKIPKNGSAGLPSRKGQGHNGQTTSSALGGPVGANNEKDSAKGKASIGQVKEILCSLAKGAEIRLASTTQVNRKAIKDAVWGTYDACLADIGVKFLLEEGDRARGWVNAPKRLDDIEERIRNAPRGPRANGNRLFHNRAIPARAPKSRNQSIRLDITKHYLQDEKDEDKYNGVPRPFEGRERIGIADKYTGPAYGDHRYRQIRDGIVSGIYPDVWMNGQTFGAIEKDEASAKRLFLGKGGVPPGSQNHQVPSVPDPKAMNKKNLRKKAEDKLESDCDSVIDALRNYHIGGASVQAEIKARKLFQNIEAGIQVNQMSDRLIDLESVSERTPVVSTYAFSIGSGVNTPAVGAYSYPAASDAASEALLEFSDACESVVNFNAGSISYPGTSYAPSEASSHTTIGTGNFQGTTKTVYSYSGGSLFNSPYSSRKTSAPSVISDAFDFPVFEPSGSLLRGHASILRAQPAAPKNLAISNWAVDVSRANESASPKATEQLKESQDRLAALASTKWGAPIAPRGKPAVGFEWGVSNCKSQASTDHGTTRSDSDRASSIPPYGRVGGDSVLRN